MVLDEESIGGRRWVVRVLLSGHIYHVFVLTGPLLRSPPLPTAAIPLALVAAGVVLVVSLLYLYNILYYVLLTLATRDESLGPL